MRVRCKDHRDTIPVTSIVQSPYVTYISVFCPEDGFLLWECVSDVTATTNHGELVDMATTITTKGDC